MKKIIIRSALITLVGLIVLGIVLYFVIGSASPKTLATFYEKVSNYEISVKYFEKQYIKTESEEDLLTLTFKLDEEKDADKTNEYIELFFKKDNYKELCEKKDRADYRLTDKYVTTKQYLEKKNVVALYNKGEFNVALEKAYVYCEGVYNEFNPLTMFISSKYSTFSIDQKNKIKEQLEQFINQNQDLLQDDIAYLGQ